MDDMHTCYGNEQFQFECFWSLPLTLAVFWKTKNQSLQQNGHSLPFDKQRKKTRGEKPMREQLLLFLLLFIVAPLVVLCKSADTSIRTVHVVFMNHFDAGFTNFTTDVVNQYLNEYFPQAIRTAQELRSSGVEARYVYTTQPWLVSLFLDCPSKVWSGLICPNQTAVQEFKDAVKRGDIRWHAFAFNSQAEVMDSSLVHYGLSMVEELDEYFGLERKITMRQADVPGITRSIIPLLVEHGVKAISVGVNGATSPPGVNSGSAFVWRDMLSGDQVIGMWHPGGYGGYKKQDCVIVPGFDEALAVIVRGDNLGPALTSEVLQDWNNLKSEFPGAKIVASSLDSFVKNLIQSGLVNTLPIITCEIGDTWIYGISTDPLKLAQFREISRMRNQCILDGRCALSDIRIKRFSRMLIKIAEHTWGVDIKIFLHDYLNWSNEKFEKVKSLPNFQESLKSWIEQRSFIQMAIDSLEDHPLASEIIERLKTELVPRVPSTSGYSKILDFAKNIETGRYSINFDSNTGAISYLEDKTTKKIWAKKTNLLAQFIYSTYDQADYEKLFQNYMYCSPKECAWVSFDFGKPGIKDIAKHGDFLPSLQSAWIKRESMDEASFLLELKMDSTVVKLAGAPETIWVSVRTSKQQIYIDIQLFNKTSTRLPEAVWISFNPSLDDPRDIYMDKMGEIISPLDICKNGSVHQHGVTHGVTLRDLTIDALDTPLVVFGEKTPFPIPINQMPNLRKGFHFNWFNNIWGTNYPAWSLDKSSKMRYILNFTQK